MTRLSKDDRQSTDFLPEWLLPPGVTRGLWEYAHAEHIADDYDNYFFFNSLFKFDEEVIARHFREPGVVLDLGCGTGRLLFPLVARGFQGVAVDLSLDMLRVVGDKSAAQSLPVDRVLANLVQLGCLADGSADYAICMFSTLGMIRGRENRQRVLQHVRRIVRPGGLLVIHVHNYWYNFWEPLSRGWFIRSWLRSILRGDLEAGDKFFDYRQIPNMFLHVFTQGELTGALRRSGFRVRELVHLDNQRQGPLPLPWLFGRFRANGWIAVCERTPDGR